MQWIDQMSTRGWVPTVKTYSLMLDGLAKKGDMCGAEQWLKRMRRAGRTPDVICYNMLVGTCLRVADAQRARAWFEQMKVDGVVPNTVCCNMMMNVAIRSGDLLGAERWYHERSNNRSNTELSVSFLPQSCFRMLHNVANLFTRSSGRSESISGLLCTVSCTCMCIRHISCLWL